MRIVVHREIPEDVKLGSAWNALVQQMERPEVFYTYEWALAVYRAYHASLTPLLMLVYEEDSLIGVASLATDIHQEKCFFLSHATADYCDFVSHPNRRATMVNAVFAELQRLHLSTLTLANLPADSTTQVSLGITSRGFGYSMFSRPAYDCAGIVLGSLEPRRGLKQSLIKRKALRYALKGLAKQGPVRLDHLSSWAAIEPVLPQFMQAHIARFVALGRVSNTAYPERQDFLRELARLLSVPGWITLTRMSAGDQPVAWNYGFRHNGSWFYYQPTFETALQQYSPGVCLLSKMVEEACDDNTIDLIDLGLGAEGYKERFANTVRQTLHVMIAKSAASCFRERVRYQAATVVKSVPRLENWIRSLLGQASSL